GGGQFGPGFLRVALTGMDLDPAVVFDVFGGANDGAAEKDLERRWRALERMSEVSPRSRTLGDKANDYRTFYDYAYRILNDPRWPKVFNITDEDKQRYGFGIVGQNFLLARNVLKADAGRGLSTFPRPIISAGIITAPFMTRPVRRISTFRP